MINLDVVKLSAKNEYQSRPKMLPMQRPGLAAGFIMTTLLALWSTAASAQVRRDTNWRTVSDAGLVLGASAVFLAPRAHDVSGRASLEVGDHWHLSMFAPAMTMAMVTALLEVSIKPAVESPRPGCGVDLTSADVTGSDCETFGGPSTHAFAAMGSMGMGFGIFFVDRFRYSSRFSVSSFLGHVLVPLGGAVLTTVGLSVAPGDAEPFEDPGQIVAGALPGFAAGLTLGVIYAMSNQPGCEPRGAVVCW